MSKDFIDNRLPKSLYSLEIICMKDLATFQFSSCSMIWFLTFLQYLGLGALVSCLLFHSNNICTFSSQNYLSSPKYCYIFFNYLHFPRCNHWGRGVNKPLTEIFPFLTTECTMKGNKIIPFIIYSKAYTYKCLLSNYFTIETKF